MSELLGKMAESLIAGKIDEVVDLTREALAKVFEGAQQGVVADGWLSKLPLLAQVIVERSRRPVREGLSLALYGGDGFVIQSPRSPAISAGLGLERFESSLPKLPQPQLEGRQLHPPTTVVGEVVLLICLGAEVLVLNSAGLGEHRANESEAHQRDLFSGFLVHL